MLCHIQLRSSKYATAIKNAAATRVTIATVTILSWLSSIAALATVVGVLIERVNNDPVNKICLRTKGWHTLESGLVSSITKYYYFRYFIETLHILRASYSHEDQDDN